MHHMKHMVGCLLVIGVVVLIRLAGDGVPGWLAGLVLLACPIMMIWMIVMMSRGQSGAADRDPGDHAHH